MKSLQHSVRQTQVYEEIQPFRAQTRSVEVGEGAPLSMKLSGLRNGEVKISEHRLEWYLNASNPSCSG